MAARLVRTPVPDAYLVNRGERAETVGLSLARSLRQQGLTVELDRSALPSANSSNGLTAVVLAGLWCSVMKRLSRGGSKPLQQRAEEFTIAIEAVAAIVERLGTP